MYTIIKIHVTLLSQTQTLHILSYNICFWLVGCCYNVWFLLINDNVIKWCRIVKNICHNMTMYANSGFSLYLLNKYMVLKLKYIFKLIYYFTCSILLGGIFRYSQIGMYTWDINTYNWIFFSLTKICEIPYIRNKNYKYSTLTWIFWF